MVNSDEGTIRIRMSDADRGNMRKVWEGVTRMLDVSTDMTKQMIVPFSGKGIKIGEDDLLILEFKAGTATSFDYGNSIVQIPVTIRNETTGQETPTFLEHADFATADTDPVNTTWTEIGAYTVTAQNTLKLGHRIPDNSRIYILATEV